MKKHVQTIMFIATILILIIIVIWGNSRSLRRNMPVFSHESGFYNENFYLSIDVATGSNSATIYYTLDGSTPTEESAVYTEPILIEDATQHENVYSMNTDTSTGFYSDLIEKYETIDQDPGYKAPDYLVDKCTIVRAMAVWEDGVVSEVATGSWFVGIEPEKYDECNFISIITNPENLFDEEKGIYVTGKKFEYYLKAGEIYKEWRWWDSNYRWTGSEWEREAVFQMFDGDGKLVLTKKGGIRTRGGVSRATLPRGLNLYAREEYDEGGTFGVALFDNGYVPQSISLTSGGNHTITQFCDYMISQRTGELNYASLTYKPYVLFLDGEYWGFYWLAEKYDEKYLEHYYDVDSQQLVMVKNNKLEIGDERDFLLYTNMVEYISKNDMAIEENFETACELIDIENFLDYYATMIYIARCDDWPMSNTAMWRTKTNSGSQYSDGKWRWLMFDCNSTCMREDEERNLITHDTLSYVKYNDPVFASLWRNNAFRERFEERIFYIADECFMAEDIDLFIAKYGDRMIPILSKSWDRFYGVNNDILKDYQDMMNSHRLFFENRRGVVEEWFKAEE